MFSYLSVPQSFIFLLYYSLTVHSILLNPFSLIAVVTSCIHEFLGLPLFIILLGG